ncbi:protein kinase superfamily protein [Actinidia rufa]|uniref:Protein kinase superfamily protein n=1 Tax=Actinidia rufa TaxID=165716 RepID=A0A7J0H2F0_9ERIC|nr:protein kinase superfamily protein [Actinidia rufa]
MEGALPSLIELLRVASHRGGFLEVRLISDPSEELLDREADLVARSACRTSSSNWANILTSKHEVSKDSVKPRRGYLAELTIEATARSFTSAATTTTTGSPPNARPLVDPPTPQPAEAASSVEALARAGVVDSAENSVDFNFFEEEFQVQLALAISVSDPDAREDPETAQIKAAKQISLGRSPSETLVDSIALQIIILLNYDEKVMDGFYDVYGITSNSAVQGKIPLLLELQAISVSDNVEYEVILVNRGIDPDLHEIEERVYAISVEHRVLEQGPIIGGLIQKIADLVVDRMGGPVSDADEMLKRWTLRGYELRNSLNSIILPLGCLDVGLSRHRALLFKVVLADRIDLPCMLIKGSYYTGTDEGAVNLIRFGNGR